MESKAIKRHTQTSEYPTQSCFMNTRWRCYNIMPNICLVEKKKEKKTLLLCNMKITSSENVEALVGDKK